MKALVVLFLFALPVDAAAKCAPSSLQAVVLTPKDAVMVANGGIVVGATAWFDAGNIAEGDVVVQKDWRFRNGKDLVVPKIDILAPGLAVYRTASAGNLELEDGKHALLVTTRVAKDSPPLLGAPKVKQVVSTKRQGRKGYTDVAVVLDGGAPATAVAIIAYDAKGTAISFGPVSQDALLVYSQHRCETLPNGTVEPAARQRITLAWVDASGRVSAKSKPVTIAGKIEGKAQ